MTYSEQKDKEITSKLMQEMGRSNNSFAFEMDIDPRKWARWKSTETCTPSRHKADFIALVENHIARLEHLLSELKKIWGHG